MSTSGGIVWVGTTPMIGVTGTTPKLLRILAES
jgi:hypothetical protein